MNTNELLDQFILESRECLEQISQRLLQVERAPDDRELLNDLFRQVHTLKGNCGLFEFKALERIVHAGEDLLDRVRSGDLAYHDGIADALLQAMDYTAELLDQIQATGTLEASCDAPAQALAASLRAQLTGAAAPAAPATAPAISQAEQHAEAPPEWLQRLPAAWRNQPSTALRYQPEPECFFKGEDPWHLALQTPGLQHITVQPLQPWPEGEAFDCYRCNLDIVLCSDAPRAYLEEHFRYVDEQVSWWAPTPASVTPPVPAAADLDDEIQALLDKRISEIWAEQRALLARPSVAHGTLTATQTVLRHLLRCHATATAGAQDNLDALNGSSVAVLAHFAATHAPNGPVAQPLPPAQAEAPVNALTGTPPRRSSPATAPDDSNNNPKVLKVAQDKIDRLMDLIGEMVVAKNALPYLATRAEEVFGQRELAREIKAQYAVINRIAEDMQHAIMQVRMLPVGTIFQRFGRLVRDLSKKLGKDVQLVIEGEDTEADKNVIESLADPLIHILRNSLDHGIESPEVRRAAGKPAQATLRVSARQEGDRVYLDISDDGAGIDTARVRAKAVERGLIPADRADTLSEAEAAQLIFLPGFSTADTISDLSGRGVGMDVVRNAVERVNGTVELASTRGQGTTVRLALPLSMAVTNVMMIEAGGRRFGVPMDLIVETVRVPADSIHHFKQSRTTVLRGRIVPLRALHELLALDAKPRANTDGELAVLVVRLGQDNVGLLVDDFDGTSDIILKPLEGVLAGMTGFAGTALMGDGSVLMILNPKELV